MSLDVLSCTIDFAEPRIQTDRLGVLISGTVNGVLQWDLTLDSNVYIDPVTSTAMLVPIPLTAAWDTTASTTPSSPYYRIPLAATDQADNDDEWVEHIPNNIAGNVYLYGLNTNDPVTTLASYEKNRGWYFSYFAFGSGESFLQLHITWGNVECWVYSDGTVYFTKGGLQVGSGSLGRIESEKGPHKQANSDAQGNAQSAQTNAIVSFVVIPCRKREILFLCNRGGAFHVVFEDIDKDDPDPTILPAGRCTWQVPTGQPMVSFAPLHHATTGAIVSTVQQLRKAPVMSATAAVQAYYDDPGFGTGLSLTPTMKQIDGSAAFVGDGSTDQCCMRVDLSGDGTNSPWLYGCSGVFAAVTANTNGAHAVVLDDFVVSAELTVPESPAGVQLTLACKNPDQVDAVVASSKPIGNRPLVATVGSVAILTGRTKSPRLEDGVNDDVARLIWEARDYWKAYETYEILDPIPWDKRGLKGVLEELGTMPGFPLAMMDIEDFDFTLPSQGQSASGDYAVIPEAGDTIAKWLLKLYEDYAKTAIVGWYPSATGPRMRFKTPAAISTTPDCTVYGTRQAALDAGYSEEEHWRHVLYDGYRLDYLEPEANSLRVTGWDSRVDKAFQVHYEDLPSQDPTLAPSARPDNWVGEPYNVAVYDSAITDLPTATYVAGVLRQRLFAGRVLADIPCEMQFHPDGAPLWRGDLLRIDGVGNWRILTMRTNHEIENEDQVRRPTTYTAQFEPEAG